MIVFACRELMRNQCVSGKASLDTVLAACFLPGCGTAHAARVPMAWNLAGNFYALRAPCAFLLELEKRWDLEPFQSCQAQCFSTSPNFFSAGCNKPGTSNNLHPSAALAAPGGSSWAKASCIVRPGWSKMRLCVKWAGSLVDAGSPALGCI